AEDQPYAEDASPIAQSPEYVLDSDFEMHLEDDDDEDPEEDPDEEDDEMDVEADEEEEEEHPAPADSVVVAPTAADQDEAASISPPPSQLPSVSRREDRPDVTLPPRKRLDIALCPRYVREFETRVRQDMDEIYTRLDDEQTERQLLAGRLNMLFRDRRAYAYTRQLMETEARMSREAWARATDASDLVYGEVISLRTTVLGQISKIKELQAADRRRQTVISELLRIDQRRSTETSKSRTALQGHITALQGQVTALQAQVATLQGQQRQQGLAGDPTQPEPPEEAGGTCDALRSTNGDDSHNSETCVRRTEGAASECTYTDFLKCQPLPFKDTEGVSSLSQWCERMESVFHISNCTTENQVKFATCTLHSVALTWWNTHVQTIGHEAAYGMSWKTLMKMMTDKYCPRNEIRKLEMEI
nr:hypothetical protein [Tanacetum cinerariifolium]